MTNTTQTDAEAIRQQIERDRELAERATEGPWVSSNEQEWYSDGTPGGYDADWKERVFSDDGCITEIRRVGVGNAEFIAASRQIVPTQADQIEMLISAVDAGIRFLAGENEYDHAARCEIVAGAFRDALAAVRRRGEGEGSG